MEKVKVQIVYKSGAVFSVVFEHLEIIRTEGYKYFKCGGSDKQVLYIDHLEIDNIATVFRETW